MVLNLIDRAIGHDGDVKYYLKDHSAEQLVQLGFSQEEAHQLAWLENQSSKGFYYGLCLGATSLYFLNPFLNKAAKSIPYLANSPNLTFVVKAGVLGSGVWLGTWFA